MIRYTGRVGALYCPTLASGTVLLFLSESFTAYLMEDNGMIKALCHYKQAPGPAHLFLFNDETN